MRLAAVALMALPVAAACGGSAGNHLVTFHAAAAGASQATQPFTFTNDVGFDVALTTAVLHIGAVYMTQSLPISGAQATSCILPNNVDVGEVIEGLDVDLLSPDPQPFPIAGEGTDLSALGGEVWLTGGPVDADDDPTHILQIDGTASKAGTVYPFTGTITIGSNRKKPPPVATTPGANPICKERIVNRIPIEFTLAAGGTLTVRADARALLAAVDFSQLGPAMGTPPVFVFDDRSGTPASLVLYDALHFATTVYRFEWANPTP
jgi:hypothetical protein